MARLAQTQVTAFSNAVSSSGGGGSYSSGGEISCGSIGCGFILFVVIASAVGQCTQRNAGKGAPAPEPAVVPEPATKAVSSPEAREAALQWWRDLLSNEIVLALIVALATAIVLIIVLTILRALLYGMFSGLKDWVEARGKQMPDLVHQAVVYSETAVRTTYASAIQPALLALILGLACAIVVGLGVFALAAHGRVSAFEPLIPIVVGLSVALGAAVSGLKNFSDYWRDGRGFLARDLSRHIPAESTLEKTPVAKLRFYHGVLQFSGAVAFFSECVFQLFVFAAVTWGVASAFPSLALFANPEALTPWAAVLFWVQTMFVMVDGPDIFGITLSPLHANPAVWPFGVSIITFKVVVLGMIIRLFQDSLGLRPSDISPAWAAALNRKT